MIVYPEELLAARVKELEAALQAIAADASVPLCSDKEMYEGWRAIAVERIDIARAALAGKAEQ
jgi:hypothetical protein